MKTQATHANSEIFRKVSSSFHGMCQPLTAMLCLLELGKMQKDATQMQATIADALVECGRLTKMVQSTQLILAMEHAYLPEAASGISKHTTEAKETR